MELRNMNENLKTIEIAYSSLFKKQLETYAYITGTTISSTITFFITKQISHYKRMNPSQQSQYYEILKKTSYRKLKVKRSEKEELSKELDNQNRHRKIITISDNIENELFNLATELGYSRNKLICKMLRVEFSRLFPSGHENLYDTSKNSIDKKMCITITDDLKQILADISKHTNIPMSNFVVHALTEYLCENYPYIRSIY